ncbi:MAG: peptidyl-prolyl cis-trans isomerase [bacterium]|nr:peptidyl-prolyl cis-trans isomerase [bacterium]
MHKIFIVIILLFSAFGISGQTDESNVLAKMGNEIITESEFIERYELTPQLYAGIKGGEENFKREVLYSIIAERLWALEAVELGLNDSELMKTTYKAIEKMYVRDALYKQEVLSKVNLSDQYLIEAFRRNSLSLNLHYIFSKDENEINNIYQQLVSGSDFYSVFLKRPESSLQEKPYVVSYGQMDKNVEDQLYQLQVGEFTSPLKAPNGWYIFRLLSTDQKIIENVKQAEEQQNYVLKVAEATLTDSIYKDFYSRFFEEAKAETNKELFLKLSNIVIDVLKGKNQKEDVQESNKIYLMPDDLYRIESKLESDLLNAEFVKINDQSATINDFLQELSIEKMYVDSLEENHIKGRLNFAIKNFIEHELLSAEGYKRRLQNSPEVQRSLKMWSSYYLSESLRKKIADEIKVTDEEANKYYLEKNQAELSIVEVKILELLTEDLDVIKQVLDELNNGKEFRELAVKFTIRQEAKNNNGELGFFPVSEYGEIGQKAAVMKIGEMYGPIKVPEGYSLFELIDRKENRAFVSDSFESVKAAVKQELRLKKYSEQIINKTVELANKYDLQINTENLSSVKVLNTTTVIYRYFGFGGKLLAVPMTTPNFLWFKKWQEQETLSP